MTLPVFPASLPKPMRSGFSQGIGDNRRLTAPDAGPIVPRARFSSVADPVSMTLDVSRDQRAVFENWYFSEVKRGVLPFLMPDPGTDGWPLLDSNGQPILLDDGQVLTLAATWLCMFSDKVPQYTVVGVRWRIAFGLSVLP